MATSSSNPVTILVNFSERIVRVIGDNEEVLLDYLAYVMIVTAAMIIMGSLRGKRLPYGRYSSPKYGWGIDGNVAWFLQELPSFAVPVYLICCSGGQYRTTVPNILLLGLFIMHYFQRTFIFSLLIRGGKVTPLMTFVEAVILCCCNGYLQGRYLTQYAVYSEDWLKDPRFLAGTTLYLTGLSINIDSDRILRNLRKPGETGYKIPFGGMFSYVSGANFLGEILEWTGFAVACWSLQGLSFAVFTICVIGPRALHHHQYYLDKFDDYPTSRKALIPFIL